MLDFAASHCSAGVVESADTQDLKSCVIPMACGFKSRLPHHNAGPANFTSLSIVARFPPSRLCRDGGSPVSEPPDRLSRLHVVLIFGSQILMADTRIDRGFYLLDDTA